MELKINSESNPSKHNCYEIILTFMFGDMDGEEKEYFYFSDLEYNNPKFKAEVHEFIKHLQSAVELDSTGRSGIDDINELIYRYGFGLNRGNKWTNPVYKWGKYCERSLEYEKELNLGLLDSFDEDSSFTYDIPSDNYDFYASYRDLKIIYYDENGNIHDVEIINN